MPPVPFFFPPQNAFSPALNALQSLLQKSSFSLREKATFCSLLALYLEMGVELCCGGKCAFEMRDGHPSSPHASFFRVHTVGDIR